MFTLMDLGMAYRKAKVDLYYSTDPSLLGIADYESNLHTNLNSLLDRLNGNSDEWVEEATFLGTSTYLPRSISWPANYTYDQGVRHSNPSRTWISACNNAASQESPIRPLAEFRLTADCSLDFHVVSALWIAKVGHLFDACLTDSAFGSRLRRRTDGELNSLSLGSFAPYLAPFQKWRDSGLDAMRSSLGDEKKIIALTADVNAFYHRLDPGYMLDLDFLNTLNVRLSPVEWKLHNIFVKALKAWASTTILHGGLPVGLPASAVVANIALIELDRIVERELVPIYYGRYVDDIMLVMENGAEFSDVDEVWEWIFKRSDGKLSWLTSPFSEVDHGGVLFKSDYLGQSEIVFSNSKNRIFILEGQSGKVLVESIARQVYERASEWRSLSRLPLSPESVATDMVAAAQADGELADNLRKADSITMRRAAFALKLRSFEAHERDLEPAAWYEHRSAFYRAYMEHVLVLPSFFDLVTYLPRVVRLATISKDFADLAAIVRSVVAVCEEVKRSCRVGVKADDKDFAVASDVLLNWRRQLYDWIDEAVIAAFPGNLSAHEETAWNELFASDSLSEFRIGWWDLGMIRRAHAKLFDHDLAYVPRRFADLPHELVSRRGIPDGLKPNSINTYPLLPSEVCDGMAIIGSWMKWPTGETPTGAAFATRPFNLAEIYLVSPDPFGAQAQDGLNSVVLALRGFRVEGKMPFTAAAPDATQPNFLVVQNSSRTAKKRVALGTWGTEFDSWTASVMQRPDPDLGRYARFLYLINQVIAEPCGIDYLVLPELAMPSRWFIRIAHKLRSRGISLIAGVEYLHREPGLVHNQIWTSLLHDGLGFPSLMVYRQDKQTAAHGEEKELHRLNGLRVSPNKDWEVPPVIRHGDFSFSMLVCSELTNIRYRASLSGNVDALFVPEWNKDIGTFDALVESASLDMHAYVVQCNVRQLGDSRIRAPYKDSWRRDIVRLKGGMRDYFVVGEIDVQSLRQFQSSHRSPSGPYKPVPDGFVLAGDRFLLPTSGNAPDTASEGSTTSARWI